MMGLYIILSGKTRPERRAATHAPKELAPKVLFVAFP